jgi:type I restriction enzyme S subunit
MNYNGGANLKEEIRERIEMINKGQVPEGYKKTKVGIIPEDWEVKRLGEVCTMYSGGTPRTSNPGYYNGDIPWLNSGDLNQRKIKVTSKTISEAGLENSSAKMIGKGDLLIALYGATSGVVAISDIEAAINQAILAIIPKEDNRVYLYNKLSYLRRSIVNKYTQGGQPNLSGKIIKLLDISFPPLPEQEKIAQILSTWDQAIELKEKLIEEKKEQKKGLMQKLLTGKVRLPGFDGEWDEVRLGDIGEFSTSSVNKKIEEGERIINLVNYMDVYNNNFIDNSIDYMKVSASESQISKFSLKIGDVLFTPSSETADDIGHSAVVKIDKKNLLYSYHLVRLRFNKEIDINFKGYVFNNKNVLREFTRLASGATRYTLTLKDFRNTTVYIPKSLQEQKSIAQILSTADKEIELLEKELDQLQLQKKGLMQLLLTGIIRVKS